MLIGYARRSPRDPTPERQRDALRAAGCARVFEDEPAALAGRRRPQLDAALAVMAPGDVLVVWKLERLAGSLRQLVATVTALDLDGFGLRSLSEPLDTTTEDGRLVFHLFAALAEFERGVARERALDRAHGAGATARLGGRPPALGAAELARAKALLREGELTVAEIAGRLGVAPSTLYRHLPGGRRGADA
jgi:DNA invertase Pin-like site-specific DNA recombinase